jgi:hypothetical protein
MTHICSQTERSRGTRANNLTSVPHSRPQSTPPRVKRGEEMFMSECLRFLVSSRAFYTKQRSRSWPSSQQFFHKLFRIFSPFSAASTWKVSDTFIHHSTSDKFRVLTVERCSEDRILVRRDFPHRSRVALGPTQSPLLRVQGVFAGCKAVRAWRKPPTSIYGRG